jgi:flagellar motility protein MotE (MotC chaperone)
MDSNVGSERKCLAREWELRGLVRCTCEKKMQTKTTMPLGKGPYHYYICTKRVELRKTCSCRQKVLRAEAAEAIWGFVTRLLKDPDTIRRGMEQLIDQERSANRGDPESNARAWADKVTECVRLRGAYQDQQAAGLMTLDELKEKLSELDQIRQHAERELSALEDHRERVEQLEEDRDALIESMSEAFPDALDGLSGEERNKVYRMLRLDVTPTAEGFSVTGALRARLQNGIGTLVPVPVKLGPFDMRLPSTRAAPPNVAWRTVGPPVFSDPGTMVHPRGGSGVARPASGFLPAPRRSGSRGTSRDPPALPS